MSPKKAKRISDSQILFLQQKKSILQEQPVGISCTVAALALGR